MAYCASQCFRPSGLTSDSGRGRHRPVEVRSRTREGGRGRVPPPTTRSDRSGRRNCRPVRRDRLPTVFERDETIARAVAVRLRQDRHQSDIDNEAGAVLEALLLPVMAPCGRDSRRFRSCRIAPQFPARFRGAATWTGPTTRPSGLEACRQNTPPPPAPRRPSPRSRHKTPVLEDRPKELYVLSLVVFQCGFNEAKIKRTDKRLNYISQYSNIEQFFMFIHSSNGIITVILMSSNRVDLPFLPIMLT